MAADIVGYSRLTSTDEDRTLARLRVLRSDLIDPAVATHNGRIVKRTGDGAIVEFRSVVDAVNCAREIQSGMVERNAGVPDDQHIVFRIGVHLGDVIEEADGDLMGDGINIAARLEGIAKPGSICLSETAYWHVKSRLDLKVSDLGLTQLKNIAEPVRVFSLETGPVVKGRAPPRRSWPRSWLAAVAVTLAGLFFLGGYWLTGRATRGPEAGHLSLVVLPFSNLSSDASQDYFADAVTANLTLELARIKGAFVIAPSTALAYKRKAIDARQIGKELGVRYLVEGSVQRDRTHVRVNAQLIDSQSGAHLWGGQFDEKAGDLFRLQDQLVSELVNNLGYELVGAEAARGTRSVNPDAIDLTMRGQALVTQSFDKPDNEVREAVRTARELFAKALQLDPSEADALAGTALTNAMEYGWGPKKAVIDYADHRQGEDPSIIDFADRALAIAPENVTAFLAKTVYLEYSQKYDEALRAVSAGLAKNPNSAVLLMSRVHLQNIRGHFDQGKADAEQAIRLSPRDSKIGFWYALLGDSELGLGNYDAAIAQYRQALDATHLKSRYLDLAVAYAWKGEMDEARSAVEQARPAQSDLTIKALKRLNCIPKWYEGLRKAGVPEE